MAKRKLEKFTRYDAADYLKSERDVIAYLEAAMEDSDPAVIATALGTVARARGMMQVARETGITREGLYKALSADGNPSLGTVLKVMKALGVRLAPQRVKRTASLADTDLAALPDAVPAAAAKRRRRRR